jgi:tetratricopeptide (TPR) repeat protein
LNSFDLTYFYDEELRAHPNNKQSMSTFVETLLVEMRNSPDIQKMGEAGGLLKILERFDEAEVLFARAKLLIVAGSKAELVNQLRWADVKRYRGHFSEAQAMFEDCLSAIQANTSFENYKDFALQHLGNLYFDTRRYESAIECFSEALKIRESKADVELIESTQLALNASLKRLVPK